MATYYAKIEHETQWLCDACSTFTNGFADNLPGNDARRSWCPDNMAGEVECSRCHKWLGTSPKCDARTVSQCEGDLVEVFHGHATPAYACAYHADNRLQDVFDGHKWRMTQDVHTA